jgi:hypothetical protein
MAYVHGESYREAIAEACGYATTTHGGFVLHRVGRVWTNYPISEYGFPAEAIDDAFLDGAPRPFRFKVESEGEAPPFPERAPRRLGRLARLDLEPGRPEDEFLAARTHQVRKAVAKAGRAGWTATVAPVTAADLDAFYPDYTRYIQERHGSPPLGRRHFEAMRHWFGERFVRSRVEQGGRVGAWLVGFLDPDSSSCQITDIVTRPDALPDRVADLAHHALVRHARALRLAAFDFGICRYEGQERYKRKWGCRFRSSYSVASDPRHHPADPESARYRLLRGVWRRLPHGLHARLGPPLRRRMGV